MKFLTSPGFRPSPSPVVPPGSPWRMRSVPGGLSCAGESPRGALSWGGGGLLGRPREGFAKEKELEF